MLFKEDFKSDSASQFNLISQASVSCDCQFPLANKVRLNRLVLTNFTELVISCLTIKKTRLSFFYILVKTYPLHGFASPLV